MNWFIYAFSSALVGVGFGILSRKLAVKSENPRALSIVFNTISSFIALMLFSFEKLWFKPAPFYIWILFFVAVILYAIFEGTQFYGRKYVDASTNSIVSRLTTIISVLVSFVFLREAITVGKIVAILLIMAGTYLVTVKHVDIKFKKGLIFILVSTIAIGVVRPIDKTVSVFFATPLYVFAVYIGPAFLMSLFPRVIRVKQLMQELRLGSWGIFLLGAFNILEYYLMIKAFALADASLVIPVVSLSTILTVLVGIIFLNERENILRKVIAVGMVFIGAILIKL